MPKQNPHRTGAQRHRGQRILLTSLGCNNRPDPREQDRRSSCLSKINMMYLYQGIIEP